MKIVQSSVFTLFAITAPAVVLADEVWFSEQFGEIVYEKDIGDTAVFSIPGSHPGSQVFMYLPGLAAKLSDRGLHNGYWIESAPGGCDSERTGADGLASDAWGDLQVEFDEPSYPTGFVVRLGSCGGDFTEEGWAAPS
jgi:hypothetical protein